MSSRKAAYVAIPAIAAGIALLVISAFAFGSVFRPGILAEVALVLYTSFLVSRVQQNQLVAAALTSLAVLVVYAASVGKWLAFDEPLLIWDVRSIDELLSALPRAYRVAAWMAPLAASAILVVNFRRPARRVVIALAPIVIFIAASWLAPGVVLSAFDAVRPDIYWRPVSRMWRAGPIYSLARQIPESILVRRELERSNADGLGGSAGTIRAAALASIARRPNVHVIVMESLVDPLNFHDAHFPVDPVDARFRRWLDAGVSLALSPTFGGQTGRAEFEVLCGVPSYAVIGIEFNVLARSMPCLPRALRDAGYRTMASVPVSPSFFRVGRAYPAVGFEERFFDDAFDVSDRDGLWMSDESLFRQALARIQAITRDRPTFDYIVSTGGHEPFDVNRDRRPPRIPGDGWIDKLANTVSYSTKAVADFTEAVEARDPDVVVVIVGDHLPIFGADFASSGYRLQASGSGGAAWDRESLAAHATPLVVRAGGRTIPVGVVPHFALSEVILDLVSDGAYCRAVACIRSDAFIYRPFGSNPAFTSAAVFPQPICVSARSGGSLCDAGLRLHGRLRLAYDDLLRLGIDH